MYDAEILIQKLMSFYNVFTISELANTIGVSQPSISNWRKHNYVKAIANKCKELGIYNEIFGDFNSNISNFQNSNINTAFDLSLNNQAQNSIHVGNNPICEQIEKMNQTIVSSFINVYKKLEKDGELKKLHQILGDLEFE